jgi:hypothetical protein
MSNSYLSGKMHNAIEVSLSEDPQELIPIGDIQPMESEHWISL